MLDEQAGILETIAIIDRIAELCRALNGRDKSDVAIGEALCDLRDDAAYRELALELRDARRSPFRR